MTKKDKTAKDETLMVRTTPEMKRALKKKANEMDRSLSWMVCNAISETYNIKFSSKRFEV